MKNLELLTIVWDFYQNIVKFYKIIMLHTYCFIVLANNLNLVKMRVSQNKHILIRYDSINTRLIKIKLYYKSSNVLII